MELLLADESLPYTIALALAGLLVGLEVLGLVAGLSPSGALDELMPFDFEGWAPSQSWSWLGLGRVPGQVWLILTLGTFGVSGLAVIHVGGASWGPLTVFVVALAGGLLLSAGLSRVIARVLPQEESAAVMMGSFEGASAELRGTATASRPAEATLVDAHGQRHYLLVEPLEDGITFVQGDVVLLVERRGTTWMVV